MISASSVKAYDKYLQYFLFLQMIFLSLTVVVGVCFRWSGNSLVWYDEVAGIQLAWITYFGSAYASLKGLHIGMPTLIKVFPKDIRKILFVLSKIIILLFFIILTYYGTKVIIVLRGDTLVTLDWIPQSFVQSVIPVSSLLIILSEIFSYEYAYEQTMKD